MRTRKPTFVAATALAAFAAAVQAGEGSHERAARELLRVMRIQEVAMSGADTMVEVMVQSSPGLAPFRDVIAEWASKVMTWDAMAPGIVEAYKSAFTEAEMRKIASFYRTPEGQKLLDEMPELMQKQAQIGTSIAQAHQGELQASLAKRAKELEEKKK